MSRRPQLSRQVPADSVQQFDDWCENEGHVNGGDKGRHAEQAIIEYLPPEHRPERFRDDLDALEADLRADLDEVGHLQGGSSSNRTLTSTPGDETVKLTYRIAEDVQESLERYVYDQEAKVRGVVGEYVAAALDEYRDGGQVSRVRRYYEQLRDCVDMIPEDRLDSIIEALRENNGVRDNYHIEEIGIAVDEALDVHSDDVRTDFIDRVIERLGFVSVKTADGLYATPERAEQFVQQHEIDADTELHLMDKDERVEYLTKAVTARSRQNGKVASVDYNQVRDEIFDGHHSNDYCYELMELAGNYPGFEYGTHNEKLMLRYIGEKETQIESVEEWLDDAIDLLHEFCDYVGAEPGDLSQSNIDNRIVQAKFPGEYDDVVGPSDRAMKAVKEEDREKVRKRLNVDKAQKEDEVTQEMNRITVESEPVTDGGQSN